MTTKKQALSAIQDAATAIDRQYPTPCLRAVGGRLMVPVAALDAALVEASGIVVRPCRGNLYAIVPGV